jgi:putative endonuclease
MARAVRMIRQAISPRLAIRRDSDHAIAREKQLKNWHRDWKINLIDANNPDWNDLGIAWGLVEGKRRTP